jgi:hypothetical protein
VANSPVQFKEFLVITYSLWLILIVSSLLIGKYTPTESADFRNVDWGMSSSQVISLETDSLKYNSLKAGSGLIIFAGKAGIKKCDVVYKFVDQTLVMSAYMFKPHYSDLKSEFDDLFSILSDIYGQPKSVSLIYEDKQVYSDGEFTDELPNDEMEGLNWKDFIGRFHELEGRVVWDGKKETISLRHKWKYTNTNKLSKIAYPDLFIRYTSTAPLHQKLINTERIKDF